MGKGINIYKVNLSTLKPTQYLKTDALSYYYIEGLNYFNNCLWLKMTNSSRIIRKKITLDSSDFQDIKDIVYTNADSPSATHKVSDIVAKYNSLMPKFNYASSIYQTTPSWKNPYKAGSLKSQVVTDTLNMLNYYRWLVRS